MYSFKMSYNKYTKTKTNMQEKKSAILYDEIRESFGRYEIMEDGVYEITRKEIL